jgi:hypothetical protein
MLVEATMSKRKIVLSYYDELYTVLSVKGSTKFVPDEVLTKQQVDSLCSTNTWDVTIKKGNVK